MFLLPWLPSQFTNGQSVFQISVLHADLLMLSYGGGGAISLAKKYEKVTRYDNESEKA